MKTFIILVLFFWGIYSAGAFLFNSFTSYNDTGDEIGRSRSGLQVFKDHDTGCEYLSRGFFSPIVIRLSSEGIPKGCNAK